MRGDRIGEIRIVVAVAGRGLDERRFRNARLVHCGEHLLEAHRPLARPFGLLPAERRERIAAGVGRNDMGMDVDDDAYSTRPTALTSFAMSSWSSRTSFANASGLKGRGSTPWAASRSRIAGFLSSFATSALMCSMTAFGVRAGASSPNHESNSYPGMSSATAGSPGRKGERLREVTPRRRTRSSL